MADWAYEGSGQIWDEQGSVPASTTGGVAVTAGVINGKGTPALVFTAARHYTGFLLQINHNGGATRFAIDLSWDAAAANIFASNIILSVPRAIQLSATPYLPIEIPSGATVYARVQTPVAAIVIRVSIIGVAGAGVGYSRCQSFGANIISATSGATVTAVIAPTLKTTWTAIGAASVAPIRAVLLFPGNVGGTSNEGTRLLWDIGLSTYAGTATSFTSTTLTDTGASWAVNAFAGCDVTMGVLQTTRAVTSNTATVLTVPSWSPSAAGVYSIGPYPTDPGALSNLFQNATTVGFLVQPQYIGPLPLQVPTNTVFHARVARQLLAVTPPDRDISILGFS